MDWTWGIRKGDSQEPLKDFDLSSLRTELPSAEMEKAEGGVVLGKMTIHAYRVPIELQNHPTAAFIKNENVNIY